MTTPCCPFLIHLPVMSLFLQALSTPIRGSSIQATAMVTVTLHETLPRPNWLRATFPVALFCPLRLFFAPRLTFKLRRTQVSLSDLVVGCDLNGCPNQTGPPGFEQVGRGPTSTPTLAFAFACNQTPAYAAQPAALCPNHAGEQQPL